MSKRYAKLGPGEGPNYDWENDHTFVKVSGQDTGGAYTLMEDNLKASFALGLHRHDSHAETFYFLEGEVDFYVDGDWHRCIPRVQRCMSRPGVPHACRVADACPCQNADDLSTLGVRRFSGRTGGDGRGRLCG